MISGRQLYWFFHGTAAGFPFDAILRQGKRQEKTMKKYLLGYVAERKAVTEEDAKKLTHICAAFGKLRRDGTIVSGHPVEAQMDQIRRWNPNIRICLSLVNHSDDANAFTTVFADPGLRKAFARSCAELVSCKGYDGVDLDWEYPCVPSNFMDASPKDRDHFTETCRVVREELDRIPGKHPLLTIAAGADLYYTTCVNLPETIRYLDFINLMTYDLKCGFHALTGHHTALYHSTGDYFQNSCDQALRLFVKNGVPKEKLLMGAGFYSRKWTDVPNRNHGFLQLTKQGGGYGPRWTDLKAECLNQNGFTYYWDDEAKAPFLFDGSTFLSFDDPRSLWEKCAYVLKEDYAGIFFWEYGCDEEGELLDVLYRGISES